MGAVIFVFNLLNNTSVIDAIYTLASYTYGPILGLFAFGIFTKKQVYDKYIPLVAIASPKMCIRDSYRTVCIFRLGNRLSPCQCRKPCRTRSDH